jgi:hypothetical protein
MAKFPRGSSSTRAPGDLITITLTISAFSKNEIDTMTGECHQQKRILPSLAITKQSIAAEANHRQLARSYSDSASERP